MQQIVNFEQKTVHFNVFWTIQFQLPYLIIQSQGKTFIYSNALIQVLNELFAKLIWKYLIDHASHCKDCISFTDIKNMMILCVRKRWFWSNMSIGFSQFYSPRYKQGLTMSTASCGMRKTDQDISS